uniref:Tyrosine-protein kinase receptor Tie-1 n=1 Tax=Mastacembelus armatus TaxID=205130 RepID=A0A7N8XFR5_9TELE
MHPVYLSISFFLTAYFIPTHLTVTANKGETVHLSMKLLSSQKTDVTWKYNGKPTLLSAGKKFKIQLRLSANNKPTLTERELCFYVDCPSMKWGPNCNKDCPECLNGGVCHDVDGDCICPPGFMGTRCEIACREGMFGRNCQESCDSKLNCMGLRFCLPDPYGCSCASGWFGTRCEKACHNDMYGADCRLSCKCQNGGVCSRFSGCQCPTGWRGQNCEKSGKCRHNQAPQILDLDSNVECNLNSNPKILCSATGNPPPSHNSIELRKLDSTVLKVGRPAAIRLILYRVLHILALTVSAIISCVHLEPPVPTTPPKLLEKRSKQLLVMPGDSYRGDGPIVSTKVHYQRLDNEDHWSSIIVYSDKDPITLMNLKPSTRYRVRVQLSRPGEGGEGALGPEDKNISTSDSLFINTSLIPTIQGVAGRPTGDNYQLLVAVVGSVTVTCVTIMLALLALFFIRKSLVNRRRTFTFQSGSGEETILQFNSGTLTLTRRPKPTPEPLTYPILDWEDIKFEDVIGEGNFGQVIKAMIKKDGNKMSAAIKMLKEFASENDHRDFAGELEVLCKLGQHPNIINLIGACENRGYLYIAIEYAPYGNLLDFLRKSRVLETDPAFAKEHGTASTLTSQQLLQFAVDVANGMHYLSDKQFIHRDLAARNVLVGDNLVAKIADFGLSRGEEVYVKKTMGRLPVRWMAIESLNYSVYTTKSDVWSFGVLLWEIVSLGGTPYCGMTCAELYEKLPQGYRMEKPKNCDDEVYELMRQCWRDRPYERPPFSQISVQLNRMQEARKAYVNMALFENFSYAGIDATAEEA